ncbi:phage major capsid protein [Polaromonas sp.]|uniref:phage major capsid protein n=1 Tax=Polaromonas sp. TaxID=1869339 RepID=UPI003751A3AC
MTNIQALREKIANLATQAKNLLANKGDQTWTPEEQAQFDGFTNEIEAAKRQIANIEKMREIDADKFFENAGKEGKGGKQGDDLSLNALEAVALFMRFGNNVTAEQAIQIRNAMSTTTTTEGGYTVPAEIAAMVIDAMKATGGMREIAQVISTAGGNSLNYPTSDGTAEVGEIVAENAAASAGEITFGTAAVNPYKYSSKKIALPWELISDSAIDVVQFVTARLAMRLARITNAHYTTGTGTGQPFGVMARTSAGKTGTTGQTLTVIYDDLFDLKHSVNRAYRRNAKWMMNDLSVAIVSKLKETTGRPIWEPSLTAGAPDMLLGYPVQTNDDVAVMAANAKSIAFGDFSQYIVRDVADSVIMRRFDDSAFALNGQVGFCGWMRTGGNLVDTAAVKHYANSAT